MHSSEREKDQSSSQCVSCKIHRTKHAKCCAEDKAPVAILQVGKFKFKPKKKKKMDGTLKPHSAKTANLYKQKKESPALRYITNGRTCILQLMKVP
jgi:hypothetical protein